MKTDAEKTMQSIRKINNFPFYTARYYGSYRLKEFADGEIKKPDDVVPFFTALFAESGRTVDLHFPIQPKTGPACSAFFCRDRKKSALIGKNLDWKRDPVLLLKTRPAGAYASLAMVNLKFCDLFQSGSFRQSLLLSPYVPLDGMNEKGLVVTMLSVQEPAEYPAIPNKISVGDFNIIRIILDTCRNTDEALSVFEKYNIMQTGVFPIHYLIADKTDSCIVEFFNGKMHTERNTDINYLTNFHILNKPEFEQQRLLCDRYRTLWEQFENMDIRIDVNEAKMLLNRVSVYRENFQVPSTVWSIIYRPEELSMKIRIGKHSGYYSADLQEK